MALIVDVSGDRRLSLGKEEFVRSFNFGSKWTAITLAVRWAVHTNSGCPAYGGNNNTRMRIGCCVGTQQPFNSFNTTYWIGINPNTFNNATWWGYQAGAGSPYLEGYNSNCTVDRRTGNTLTQTADDLTNGFKYIGCRDDIGSTRSTWMLNIVRIGATFYFSTYSPSIANVQASYPANDYDFFTNIDRWAGSESGSGLAYGYRPANSIANVPSPYHLMFDTFSFCWHNDANQAEISDIFVVRAR